MDPQAIAQLALGAVPAVAHAAAGGDSQDNATLDVAVRAHAVAGGLSFLAFGLLALAFGHWAMKGAPSA